MITIFILEIPTGVFADVLGRKISVLISYVILIISMLVYFCSHTFIEFAIAEVLFGIGACFHSGAFDALLKDNLDFYGYKEDIGKVFSQGNIVRQVAVIVGGVSGALIANYHLRIQWLIGSFGYVISFWLVIFLIPEENFNGHKINWKNICKVLRKIWRQSLKHAVYNRKVLNIILLCACFMAGVQALNMLWSPLVEQKLGIEYLSIGWAGISLFSLLGSWYAKRKLKNDNHLTFLMYSIVITFIFVLLSSVFTAGLLILITFWLHETGRGIFNPVHNALLQNNIPSEVRATVTSFCSQISHAGAGIGLILAGVISTCSSIQTSWLISSLIILSSLFFVCRIKKS